MIGRLKKLPARQFFTFAAIGVVNTLIHWLALFSLVELMEANVVAANGCAFMLANAFSYVANTIYTFRAPLAVRGYIKFFTASLLALGLTLLVSWLAQQLGWHYFYGFVMIVFLVPALNFAVLKFLVYR